GGAGHAHAASGLARLTANEWPAAGRAAIGVALRSVQGQPGWPGRAIPAAAGRPAPHTAPTEHAPGGIPGADTGTAVGVAVRSLQGQPGDALGAVPAPAGRRASRPARDTRTGDVTGEAGATTGRTTAPAPTGPAETATAVIAATARAWR
ncbi:MAG TPA: hypothetical protein VF821_13250, partial [Lentzea sp.]